MIEPTPILALVARAARLYARRWPLYVACAVVACALQVGIDLTHALDPRLLDLIGGIVVVPIFAAIVYGFVASDAIGETPSDGLVWERLAERIWAVIVIDAITLVVGLASPGPDVLLAIIYLMGNLILAAFLMYADVHAVVEPDLSAASVVPQSVLASARIAMTRVGYSWAVALVLVQLLVGYGGVELNTALGARALGVPAFGSILVATIALGPLAALVTVVYLELRQPRAK